MVRGKTESKNGNQKKRNHIRGWKCQRKGAKEGGNQSGIRVYVKKETNTKAWKIKTNNSQFLFLSKMIRIAVNR